MNAHRRHADRFHTGGDQRRELVEKLGECGTPLRVDPRFEDQTLDRAMGKTHVKVCLQGGDEEVPSGGERRDGAEHGLSDSVIEPTIKRLDERGSIGEVDVEGALGHSRTVSLDELDGVDWIAGPAARGEQLLGVWPGLAGRPRIAHTVRDWLTKLQLVAADCGLTTVPPDLADVLPEGVQIMRVQDGPQARRRALAARMPGRPSSSVAAVTAALRSQFAR
jgi:LysR substrate binding domain